MKRPVWVAAGAAALAVLAMIVVAGQALPRSDQASPEGAAPPSAPAPVSRPPGAGSGPAQTRDPSFTALPGAVARWGAYEGGVYRIELPDAWNGGLVLYAHGYRGEGAEVWVSDPPLREHLIASGYAWAASSYRGNGYRPDWGMEDTLALRELFIREVGEPRRSIISGESMGGHVVVASLELHPDVYQGALAACGALTGIGVIDYLAAYTAAAEYISGVSLLDVPLSDFARTVASQWLPAMGRPGAYTERGRRFDSVVKYLTGGDLPFRLQGLAARYAANLLPGTDPEANAGPAGRAVDTRAIRYRIDAGLGLSADDLNAGVRRLSPAEGARSAAENAVFAPFSGRITAPLLTLHTTGDAWVPFSLEQDYRRLTLAAGADRLLVQRAVRRPGHCELTQAELARAFDDLVAWIEQGVAPEGDDVLTGDVSGLGLRWTVPLRADDPARR